MPSVASHSGFTTTHWMSPQRIGTFAVLAELGAGPGSCVHHIRREADEREYALKVVAVNSRRDLKYLDQLRHEFRVGQMFDHPNLIKVYALEIEKTWLFRPKAARLLLEFAPGQTMNRTPPLRFGRLMRVFAQVADALAHMHGRGVCHADLKPDNLILGPGTAVKVIDYGLAWVEGEPKDRVQGTPEYMAPETKARRTIDARTDIFNLGATLYRLTAFRCLPESPIGLPVGEKTYARAMVPVGRLNPSVPPGLCDLIHWCVEFNPDRRPQRMYEVREALLEVASEWDVANPEPL